MAQLADALGVRVVHARLPAGARGFALRQDRTVIIHPSGYPPREQFSLAHELIEINIPSGWLMRDEVLDKFCDRGAAALLLPSAEFLCSLHGTGWDLAELRRRWPWASWALIASRLQDLVEGASAATWVNGAREWWRFPHDSSVAELLEVEGAERAAVDQVFLGRGAAIVQRRRVRARAWRLSAKGKRVAIAVCRRE